MIARIELHPAGPNKSNIYNISPFSNFERSGFFSSGDPEQRKSDVHNMYREPERNNGSDSDQSPFTDI